MCVCVWGGGGGGGGVAATYFRKISLILADAVMVTVVF